MSWRQYKSNMAQEVELVEEYPPPPAYYVLFNEEKVEETINKPPIPSSSDLQPYNGILDQIFEKPQPFDSTKNYKEEIIR
jgi:hypothetical protein